MDPQFSLRIFQAVVNERSFTRAGERLGRTQSAISQAIHRLEEDLGETLLDRSGRDLLLTDAGKVVFEAACRQENLNQELMHQLQELRNKSVGRITLGANESMTPYLLPLLVRFRRRYPKVKVVVRRSRSSELPENMLRGDVDFGFSSHLPKDERFDAISIARDHLSFVVAPNHRLASRDEISIRDLSMESFIAHNVNSPYREKVIQTFTDSRVDLNMDLEMPSIEGIRLMVQAGEGVAFLPYLCVKSDLEAGLLKEVKVQELWHEREIYLLRIEKKPLSHAAEAFLSVIKG
ncbi:LysR family transcriptional regulator [Holophaga foetida]|uniref:LysR family transcriptional regulator n=1 Tax=Holophaga foetida TaxID=35839 RepID=UPI00024753AD|nr:LysR family transcriptional regulator [Holophaga foetida]